MILEHHLTHITQILASTDMKPFATHLWHILLAAFLICVAWWATSKFKLPEIIPIVIQVVLVLMFVAFVLYEFNLI